MLFGAVGVLGGCGSGTATQVSGGASRGNDALDSGVDSGGTQVQDSGAALTQDSGSDACSGPCSGTCTNGRCLVTLASSPDKAAAVVAVDATNVYWSYLPLAPPLPPAPSIMKVPIDGGATVTLVATQLGISTLAAAGGNVYWSENGALLQTAVSGGATTTLAASGWSSVDAGAGTPAAQVEGLAVGPGGLYVANETGSIMTVPFDGGAPSTLASVAFMPLQLAVTATGVYWTNCPAPQSGSGCYPGSTSGVVLGTSLGGGTVSTFATGLSPAGIAVDSEYLYVESDGASTGSLLVVPLDGGPTSTVAAAGAGGVAADDTNVYWMGDGEILRMPRGGGTVVTLVTHVPTGMQSALGSPAIAVDATSVYWIGTGNGPLPVANGDTVVMKLTPK
jgi:hypothetical protein